ncbi:hypothetical protein Dimus_033010 [Dionaea muscipula]
MGTSSIFVLPVAALPLADDDPLLSFPAIVATTRRPIQTSFGSPPSGTSQTSSSRRRSRMASPIHPGSEGFGRAWKPIGLGHCSRLTTSHCLGDRDSWGFFAPQQNLGGGIRIALGWVHADYQTLLSYVVMLKSPSLPSLSVGVVSTKEAYYFNNLDQTYIY